MYLPEYWKKLSLTLTIYPSLDVPHVKGATSRLIQFSATKSHLKIKKKASYISPLKLVQFSRDLKFCFDFLVM